MADLATVQEELGPERGATEQAMIWLRDQFQIATDSDLDWAGERLKEIKARWKELEETRTAITKPILDSKRRIDDLFEPVKSALSKCEQILKFKIADFTKRREDERRSIMAQSATEHAAGGTPTAIIPAPAQTTGITVKQVWDFEIIDPKLVPRELCKPDERLIRLCIQDGDREIPGVKIFQRGQVSARIKP